LMVAGDEAGCAEAREFFAPVETASVKKGVGRQRADALPGDDARKLIHDAAQRAIALVGEAQPLKPQCPMDIVLELCRADYCDDMAQREGVERVDARTVRKVTSDALGILF
jgi:D-amino peptidase